jgi:mRNA-degrading endonuclease RelE of RelBE toxin-antitoxin system
MTRHIVLVPRARKSLITIAKWLRSRSPRGATAWYKAFWAAAARISADPESYPAAEESPRLKRVVRQALFKTRRGRTYRIIFDFTKEEVIVYCIRRPGQRPWQRRDLPD